MSEELRPVPKVVDQKCFYDILEKPFPISRMFSQCESGHGVITADSNSMQKFYLNWLLCFFLVLVEFERERNVSDRNSKSIDF